MLSLHIGSVYYGLVPSDGKLPLTNLTWAGFTAYIPYTAARIA